MLNVAQKIGWEREMRFAALLDRRGLKYIYQPEAFIINPKKWPRKYRPDFFVPVECKYYEVIGSRQRLRDKKGAFLKKIEMAEKLFGIRVEIVKPNGEPYPRKLHGGKDSRWKILESLLRKNWLPDITAEVLAEKLNRSKRYTQQLCRRFGLRLQSKKMRSITYRGITMSIREWERYLRMGKGTLNQRLFVMKWPIEKALSLPPQSPGLYERGAEWREGRRHTHCKHGHPFDEKNTYIEPNGRRYCRICGRARARRWREKFRIL